MPAGGKRQKTPPGEPRPGPRAPRRFVILTGLSGSGKTQAIRALEDLGYFCIDNLPTQLIPTMADLATREDAGIDKVAIVVDELLGQQQVVIKSLESNFRRMDGIAGATILGDGHVTLILDVPGLTALARSRSSRAPGRSIPV